MNLKVVKYCCKLEIRKKLTVLHKYGFSLEMLHCPEDIFYLLIRKSLIIK